MKEQKHDLVPDENPSNDQPGWFRSIKKKSTICELYPHCKLGDGFAQFAVGSDTACMLIWRIDGDTDVDAAAFNLEKAKEFLVREEPGTDQVLAFILDPVRRIDKAMYEARNIAGPSEPPARACRASAPAPRPQSAGVRGSSGGGTESRFGCRRRRARGVLPPCPARFARRGREAAGGVRAPPDSSAPRSHPCPSSHP